jgi:hypothetical protein
MVGIKSQSIWVVLRGNYLCHNLDYHATVVRVHICWIFIKIMKDMPKKQTITSKFSVMIGKDRRRL